MLVNRQPTLHKPSIMAHKVKAVNFSVSMYIVVISVQVSRVFDLLATVIFFSWLMIYNETVDYLGQLIVS